MNYKKITPSDGKRICSHMNNDHQDAIFAYANYYGGIKNPTNAKMIGLNSKLMRLEVDDKQIEICFDHTLLNSEDAHQTLVAMLKAIPKPN